MEGKEYLIFVIWCISVFIFYKILKRINRAVINREIDQFFISYGGKNS